MEAVNRLPQVEGRSAHRRAASHRRRTRSVGASARCRRSLRRPSSRPSRSRFCGEDSGSLERLPPTEYCVLRYSYFQGGPEQGEPLPLVNGKGVGERLPGMAVALFAPDHPPAATPAPVLLLRVQPPAFVELLNPLSPTSRRVGASWYALRSRAWSGRSGGPNALCRATGRGAAYPIAPPLGGSKALATRPIATGWLPVRLPRGSSRPSCSRVVATGRAHRTCPILRAP